MPCAALINPPPPPPEGEEGNRPPFGPPPVIAVLDANHDRELSETEIAGAVEALKNLDQNGDGKLDRHELRPKPPEGADGHGPQHPRGKRDGGAEKGAGQQEPVDF